jgi:hypothetical protein
MGVPDLPTLDVWLEIRQRLEKEVIGGWKRLVERRCAIGYAHIHDGAREKARGFQLPQCFGHRSHRYALSIAIKTLQSLRVEFLVERQPGPKFFAQQIEINLADVIGRRLIDPCNWSMGPLPRKSIRRLRQCGRRTPVWQLG